MSSSRSRYGVVFSARNLLDPTFSPTPEQEMRFFSQILLRNGTYKRTEDHRMDDLNALVLETWGRYSATQTAIMDVGVSSGISTLEWFQVARAKGYSVKVTGTDLQIYGWLKGSKADYEVLVDADEFPLLHNLFGAGFSAQALRKRDFVSPVAGLKMLAGLFRVMRKGALTGGGERVLLVSPRVSKEPGVQFQEDNILSPNKPEFIGRFSSVRIANLLNLDYFSREDLTKATRNLVARLAGEGSFLIVNRTIEDASNHGTIFRLSAQGKLEAVARIGTGSEVEEIVLAA